MREDSPQSILGQAAEIVTRDRIQITLRHKGLAWTAVRRTEKFPVGDPRNAIDNSREGDVHVLDQHSRRRVSFEVKASQMWPNATITESELLYSEADYLVGVTTAGLWICTMEEARRVAQKKYSPSGTFYIVPEHQVEKLTFDDIFEET